MNAAQAYWAGSIDAFESAVINHAPKPLLRATREIATEARDTKKVPEYAYPWLLEMRVYRVTEEINTVATEATERALGAMEKLEIVVDKFRANTRNDLASMKAHSDRVQSEVEQMTVSYSKAVQLLTSHEFVAAMQNAERFVAAIKAINELQATRVVLQMFDNVDVKGL